MRFDLDGMLWTDTITERKAGQRQRVIPLVPDTGWTYPRDFPNLNGVQIIGFDTETKDPGLKEFGAGWATGNGHIVGVSIATEDRGWYWPLHHEYNEHDNVSDPSPVWAFLKDILEDPSITKVGANLLYDIGWAWRSGINVQGKLLDVLYAAALLDEESIPVPTLDNLAQHHLGIGKESSDLYEWSSLAYGGKPTGEQRKNMYRCPPTLVGPYAEADAVLPLRIIRAQQEQMSRLGLSTVFDLESRLIPLLLRMRIRGVPVDLERVDRAIEYTQQKQDEAQEKLNEAAGFSVGVYTTEDIARFCDANGIEYPRTEKTGKPSFRKTWLANHAHPAMQLVQAVRKYDKVRGTFLENAIKYKNFDGKLFPTFHPLKGEEGGTGYGRFSSSNPNAQQIPSRDKELAPLVRGCFIPEPGYPWWLKMDLSQIEYRLFAHHAVDGASIRKAYEDPDTDFHNMVSAFLEHRLPRGPVKNINFGKLYGMQTKTFSNQLREQLSRSDILELLSHASIDPDEKKDDPWLDYARYANKLYDDRFPQAKETLDMFSEMASRYGYVKTILGRRAKFPDVWAPAYGKDGHETFKGSRIEAERYFYAKNGTTEISRLNAHKALNHVLQGSAADLLKLGMVLAYEAGVFETLGYPHVTVHDELDFSYHDDLAPYARQLKYYIENAYKLQVPVILDSEKGRDWGHVEDCEL